MDPAICSKMTALSIVDPSLGIFLNMHDLPLDVLTAVCLRLDLHALVRFAAACRRFQYGNGGLETLELPASSPVIMVLLKHAFPGGDLIPSTRPVGCSESWVAYLSRCARQRRCREAPPIAVGYEHGLFVDAAGQVLTCSMNDEIGHYAWLCYRPIPVATMAAVRVQSVAVGSGHSLALGWAGQVYSWGQNDYGQLGHGDKLDRLWPKPIEGLEGVCDIAAVDKSRQDAIRGRL
jgi:alpha-tubulin suppressor-like RCC1 family protein